MAAYTNPLRIGNGLDLDFTMATADTGADGFLGVAATSGQVTRFASVPATRVSGGAALTEVTSAVLTLSGGLATALLTAGTIQVKLATTGQSGYLSSADWNTFNNKLSTTLTSANVFVGSGSNVAVGVTMSGVIAITNTGVTSIVDGSIIDADVNANAAIAVNKLAALSTSLLVVTDGSGFITTSAGFTTAKVAFLSTISSDVQAQFTNLAQRIVNLTTTATVQAPGASQNGYAIIWDNANTRWDLGPVGAGGSVTGPGSSTDRAIVRWNSTGGTSLLNSTWLLDDSGNMTAATSITLDNSGLHIFDTNASHDLIITPGSDLTTDRILTLTTGDAARTITLSGNPTLNDWFDQSVKVAASVAFADATLSNVGGLHILDSDSSHDLIFTTSSNLTADRTLTFIPGDANRSLTINASGTIYVTGGTDVSVADGGTALSTIAARSIWVANAVDTITTLTPGALQSVRINAGNTAWEVFTPTAGGIDGTMVANRIPYGVDADTLTTDSALTWDATNDALTVGLARIFTKGITIDANLFIGENAGNFTTTAIQNIGIGYNTLNVIAGGSGHNVAIGITAGQAITTAQANTLLGSGAGSGTSFNGSFNTLIGNGAGGLVSTGAENIFLGYAAGDNVTTGSKNIAIGSLIDLQSAIVTGQLSIQNIIFGLSNTAEGTTVSTGFIGIGQPAPTYQLHITGNSANKNLFLIEEDGGVNILEIIEAAGVNKIGVFAAAPVAQQSGLTAFTHTAPGTPDYAIQDLVAATGFGFVTKDEGNTILSVVKAMQDAMKLYGWLT